MSFLKNYWRFTLPITVVVLCLIEFIINTTIPW